MSEKEPLNQFLDEVVKKVETLSNQVVDRLAYEKQKAEIKSQIGHTSREIAKQYERLGQLYYASLKNHEELHVEDIVNVLETKQQLLDLLHEKLNSLTK